MVAGSPTEHVYRLRLRAPRLRRRPRATLDVASLRRNWYARRHRAPFPIRLDLRRVSSTQLQPSRLLVGIGRSRRHRSSHRKCSREWRAIYTPSRLSSPLMTSSTEVVAGVPQIVYRVPLDGSASPLIADLDFAQIFDRLIVGPTPYPWPIYGAFVEALKATGVANAEERVFVSNIPIRA